MMRTIVLIPLLFASILFAFDKVLLIRSVRDRTLHFQKSEPEFYENRHTILEMMRDRYQKKDGHGVAMVLGSSRSGSFSPIDIERHAPGAIAYNFSVPMGGMVHSYYWTERALQLGVRPAFLLLEADAATFSEGSLAFMLQYDFDPVFVLRNTAAFAPATSAPLRQGFTLDEADTWFLKYLFATYRYPVDLHSIRENYRKVPGGNGLRFMDLRFHTRALMEKATIEFNGGIPNAVRDQADDAFLEKDAGFMEARILAGQSYSKTQYYFFQRLLDLAARESIPVIVHKPVLSDPFARALARQAPGFDDQIRSSVDATARASVSAGHSVSFFYVDPEAEGRMECRAFVDSMHLGGRCFAELTNRIFAHIKLPPGSSINER